MPTTWTAAIAAARRAATLVLVCGAVGVCAFPQGIGAQVTETGELGPRVSGVVTDASDGAVLASALVSVQREDGTVYRSVLTGGDGRYSFVLPEAGRWGLGVSRLGYQPSELRIVELEAGDTRVVNLELTGAPIALEAIEVESAADGVCRALGDEEGTLLVRLWEQARTALDIVAWAEREERYEFDLVRWERTVELFTNRVQSEERGSASRSVRPFEAAPLDELLEEGWIQQGEEPQEFVYYGIDAATLLSDRFQQHHCFQLARPSNDAERVGLAFEPVRDLGVPGVQGVLWLDREDASLEELEFHYTRHPHEPPIPPEVSPLFRGRVEFRTLPDGGWVIDRWSLRMPQYQFTEVAGHRFSAGRDLGFAGEFAEVIRRQSIAWQDLAREARLSSVEQGGEIHRIVTPDGELLPRRETAILQGVVFDSTRMRVLEGASVELVGTGQQTRTGTTGRFLIEAPMDGRYEVRFRHPRLDQLDILELPSPEVTLERGTSTTLNLAVPSERTLNALLCGVDPEDPSESAILVGRTLESESGTPLPGALVTLRPAFDQVSDRRTEPIEVHSDGDGRYRVCGIPPGIRLNARMNLTGIESDPRGIEFAPGAVVQMDLELRVATAGVVRGVVLQGDGESPVSAAHVRVEGGDRVADMTTGSDGRFQFPGLPAGSYEIDVTHMAFQDLQTPAEVEVQDGMTTNLTVRLLRDAIALDAVEVVVDSRPTWGPLVEVYDRRDLYRRLGQGAFIDRDEIDEIVAGPVSRVLGRLPGVRIVPTGISGTLIRIHRTRDCPPSLYIDGMQAGHTDDNGIDDMLPLSAIEMIEVYRSLSELPGEMADAHARQCGAIGLWTRRGG